jgi:hypothetical protein
MVERGADVLKMDPAQPVKQSGWGRLDATLRKTPGLGFFVVLVILDHLRRTDNTIAVVGFSVMVVGALAEEYWPSIRARFNAKPPAGSSEPSVARS